MTVPEQEEREDLTGRPRSAQSHWAILDATLELVAEEGIQGASIEGIAARAGVGKTTIYRRWPSKEASILSTPWARCTRNWCSSTPATSATTWSSC